MQLKNKITFIYNLILILTYSIFNEILFVK